MANFIVTHGRQTIAINTPDLELAFSRDDGGLRVLRHLGGPNVVGHGDARPSINVRLGENWLAEHVFVRYLDHTVSEQNNEILIEMVIGLGPLIVYDSYHITGTLIRRTVAIRNVGEDAVQLTGVRLELPWARVGSFETCRFEAPGNSVRPRVPLGVAAIQRNGVLPRRFFAPGLRGGRAMEPAPTHGPGVLALHDPETDEALLCWYYSTVEAALPQIEGNDVAVTLRHEIALAGWLSSETRLNAGSQYIMLLHESWLASLGALQRTWSLCGIQESPGHAPWVRDAAIYETHPSQFGGLPGLTAALPGLRDLGINTLCLMPIWDFVNPRGRMWDGNWHDSGNPYAIRSYESIDPTLGDANDLRTMVQSAHRIGIRVLVDLPLIGCAGNAQCVSEHADWFCYDQHGRLAHALDDPAIIRFDWANQNLQEHMLTWAMNQARTYDFDGFRAIVPRTPQPNWSHEIAHHASAGSLGFLRLLERLQREIKNFKPDGVLLDELCGPAYVGSHDFALDELPHHMFVHMALNRVTPAELGEWLEDYRGTLPSSAVRACFTENHYTRVINPLADGLRGSRISKMLLTGMVLCGFVPMIWHGQEHNEEDFIRQLLHIRARYPALRYGEVFYNALPCDNSQVLAILRDKANPLIGILNVGPHKQTVILSIPVDMLDLREADYELYDLFVNKYHEEEQHTSWRRDELLSMKLTLEPFAACCFAIRPAGTENLAASDLIVPEIATPVA